MQRRIERMLDRASRHSTSPTRSPRSRTSARTRSTGDVPWPCGGMELRFGGGRLDARSLGTMRSTGTSRAGGVNDCGTDATWRGGMRASGVGRPGDDGGRQTWPVRRRYSMPQAVGTMSQTASIGSSGSLGPISRTPCSPRLRASRCAVAAVALG